MLLNLCLHFSFIPILLIIPVLVRCIPKLQPKIAPLQNYLFWNGTIRLYMVAYIDYCLFAMLNLSEMVWIDNQLAIDFSNYLSYIKISLVLLIPAILLAFMCYNRKNWDDEKFSKKYGSYLDGMASDKPEIHSIVLITVTIFFARRLVLCATLVFWQDFLWGQVALQFMTSTWMIIMLQWWKPLEDSYAVYIETFNEVLMLFLLYTLLLFSDFVKSPETRNTVGFAYIAMVGTFAGVHVIILLKRMVCDCVTKIRRKLIIRKRKKELE